MRRKLECCRALRATIPGRAVAGMSRRKWLVIHRAFIWGKLGMGTCAFLVAILIMKPRSMCPSLMINSLSLEESEQLRLLLGSHLNSAACRQSDRCCKRTKVEGCSDSRTVHVR